MKVKRNREWDNMSQGCQESNKFIADRIKISNHIWLSWDLWNSKKTKNFVCWAQNQPVDFEPKLDGKPGHKRSIEEGGRNDGGGIQSYSLSSCCHLPASQDARKLHLKYFSVSHSLFDTIRQAQ